MANDGISNEYKIIKAYNNKKYSELSIAQKGIIDVISNECDVNTRIYAEKIKGSYKPDLKFIILKKENYISVKKGSGNSVHQEKLDTFIAFCEEYLDMPERVKNYLSMVIYADGTVDGTGNIQDRLSDEKIKFKYKKEIEVVNAFFAEHTFDLIERFLVTGRLGRDTGIIAEYLYHGTDNEGVVCPLSSQAIQFISSITRDKEESLHIGPFTLQIWNRNLSGNPKTEDRRHSIQIKCGSKVTELISKVNNYLETIPVKSEKEIEHNRWSNLHGFKNQEFIINAINGRKYKDLNSNLRNLIKEAFPEVKNKDTIYAEKIVDNKAKPKMKLTINSIAKFFSIKIGTGNSVHQEKIETFLSFCENELKMSLKLKETLLLFLYGDGTIDGSGKIDRRMSEANTIKKLGEKFTDLNKFFYRNRKQLAKRFLQTGAYSGPASEYIYYGTERSGVTVAYNKIIEYVSEFPYQNNCLSVGPLRIQTWNRNIKGTKEFEYKRNSIQVKWPHIDFDLSEVKLQNLNNYAIQGTQGEYDLVSLINRFKSPEHFIWKEICQDLHLSNLKNVFAVRVTNRQLSQLSGKKVNPKSDIFLVESNFDQNFLINNNYWLDEDNIKNKEYRVIPGSGISCKLPSSKSFTYQKLTVDSFKKLFNGNAMVGCGISLFVNDKDINLNKNIIKKWNVDKNGMKKYFSKVLDTDIPDDYYANKEYCQRIKLSSESILNKIINDNEKIQDILFRGRYIFEEPYCAEYIYTGGILEKIKIPKYSITNGSGRHKGNITVVIKPR